MPTSIRHLTDTWSRAHAGILNNTNSPRQDRQAGASSSSGRVKISPPYLSVIHWLFKVLSKAGLPDTEAQFKAAPITNISRPAFNELPLRKEDPRGSACKFWGKDDELGSLNSVTEDVSRPAAGEVALGKSVNLKYILFSLLYSIWLEH